MPTRSFCKKKERKAKNTLTYAQSFLYFNYHFFDMKAFSILSVLALAAASVQAAPVISIDDLSEAKLKEIGSARQQASLQRHADAVAKATREREQAIEDAKKLTEENDKGMKKTIQKRMLNNMLPPCDREPEAPREPGDYRIRF